MKKQKHGFGLIGCGAIARIHAEAIMNIKDASIVAVYDYSFEFATGFAEKYGCKAYETLEELLADGNIDIVNICTPSGLHSQQVVAAANAKKNIIVEKPMAITQRQMEDAIAAVEANGVKLEVISQLRFTQPIRLVKQAVDSGKLGKIYLANFRMLYYRSHDYYGKSGWRGTWAMDGGGALMNQGIHGIDLVQYIMGGVKSVQAQCATLARDIEVEDTANILVEYSNGALGVIQGTTVAKPGYPRTIEIHGENGSVVIREDTIEKWDVEGMPAPDFNESKMDSLKEINNFSEDYHMEQFLDLMDAIDNDRKPAVDMYDGKKPVDIILAAYESSKTGKKIEL